jgi:hypothetical protein
LLQQLKESPSKTNATLQGPGKIIMAHDAIQVCEVGVYCDPVLGLEFHLNTFYFRRLPVTSEMLVLPVAILSNVVVIKIKTLYLLLMLQSCGL